MLTEMEDCCNDVDYHVSGKPIFSIDIHPDGSRFATGGQGKYTFSEFITTIRAVGHKIFNM